MNNRAEIEEFYQEEIWKAGMKPARKLTEEDCEEITHVTAFYVWKMTNAVRELLEPFKELMIKFIKALEKWMEGVSQGR